MTPDDLAAIRARDSGEAYDDIDLTYDDRRTLLAEVDRLTEGVRWLTADAAAWRKAAEEIGNADIAWEGGAAAERSRIRKVVVGLPAEWNAATFRAAVLAAIDGETT